MTPGPTYIDADHVLGQVSGNRLHQAGWNTFFLQSVWRLFQAHQQPRVPECLKLTVTLMAVCSQLIISIAGASTDWQARTHQHLWKLCGCLNHHMHTQPSTIHAVKQHTCTCNQWNTACNIIMLAHALLRLAVQQWSFKVCLRLQTQAWKCCELSWFDSFESCQIKHLHCYLNWLISSNQTITSNLR